MISDISWADIERDLTAWKGNALQEDALNTIYKLEAQVKASENPELIATWRSLQTSDHFTICAPNMPMTAMCTNILILITVPMKLI
jgi:alpha-amylase/alpha-mannosidase (GH57 family)